MRSLIQLSALGYETRLAGGDIKLTWRGQGEPDPSKVRPLIREISSHKESAIEFLKAQHIASLPLEEFARGFQAIRVWSETLEREVWFVSNDRAVEKIGVNGTIFTGEELVHLLKLNPTVHDLKRLVKVKEAFHCSLVGVEIKP